MPPIPRRHEPEGPPPGRPATGHRPPTRPPATATGHRPPATATDTGHQPRPPAPATGAAYGRHDRCSAGTQGAATSGPAIPPPSTKRRPAKATAEGREDCAQATTAAAGPCRPRADAPLADRVRRRHPPHRTQPRLLQPPRAGTGRGRAEARPVPSRCPTEPAGAEPNPTPPARTGAEARRTAPNRTRPHWCPPAPSRRRGGRCRAEAGPAPNRSRAGAEAGPVPKPDRCRPCAGGRTVPSWCRPATAPGRGGRAGDGGGVSVGGWRGRRA